MATETTVGNVTVTVAVEGAFDFYATIEAVEKALLAHALTATADADTMLWNKSKAALFANLKRPGMLAMLTKYGMM